MANPKIEVEIGAITSGLKKGVDGAVLSLSQLEKRAKQLQANLNNATDVRSIATYNRRLEETKTAIQQIKTIGLQSSLQGVGISAQSASSGVSQLARATSSYNGVGIEFSRIIQDAPFGIIGVGNNITQLATSFQNLRAQSTSTGAALKTAFQSIISPANLLVLGISAVTTALTLYQMNARKSKEETDQLTQAYDDLADSAQNAADKIAALRLADEKFFEEIDNILGIDENFRLLEASSEQLDEILRRAFSSLSKEQLDALKGRLNELATDQLRSLGNELSLTREQAIEFIEQVKNGTVSLDSLSPSVLTAVSNYRSLQPRIEAVNGQLGFYDDKTKNAKKNTDDLNESLLSLNNSILSFSTQPLVDAYFEAVKQGNAFRRSLESAASGLTGNEGDQAFSDDPFGIMPTIGAEPPIKEIADTFVSNLERIEFKANELGQAFSGLGALIGSAFNNTGLGQFVGEFLRFASQLVAANFKISTANAITSATSSAAATGPGAIFTLPAFIAGAIGLVASAFAAIGGGSKSSIGSSGVGGASAQTFAGSGAGLDLNRSLALTGEFRINGRDLVYVIDESRSQNASG